MKITTLIENTQDENQKLNYEHGISMFIETEKCNILFDTGKTGNFIENAEKLNIDLKSIDVIILSHAHYDHCGGVRRLLETYNITPQIIVSEHFFQNSNKFHYSDGSLKSDFSKETGYTYVGIDFNKEYLQSKGISINFVQADTLEVSDDVFVFSNFNKYYDFEKLNKNMKLKIDNDYKIDTFNDEIAVGLKTKDGIVVLLGCAHPGFLNIVKTIQEITKEKIVGIVGGTHLIEADEERVDKSIECINNLNVNLLGLSHCTGDKAVKMFHENCKNSFMNITGTILRLE
ncbi:MBL fold metallo-hydrolase [Clostridium estertheticum]|uniref:Hydrolase n=2 Tax=Clostridium estertheticum TaxID=238834 RepID=A0A1J0GIV2_9CLOT|nr:MBL fold metallo-hydrolase [Clostridium estertheticum]APC41251.1 hydrolase [Clostridium estertheticum subsp. estertheticum]MBU3073082.1 MBL fold metallo-hydrolase [Clostridium estertheticum]MBU3162881.1 MBL fold metallo-hydrolase [Clostridium estertheticum]MBU3174665.1 MBL fold metallo-hydrolase [Clostridium estertheticum]MBZ9616920.1 MBL fold metallo-hydrolase [Clostridium estertheticum subsp. laramiense]